MQVGEVYKTNNWGDIVVLEKLGNKSKIKFINTGNSLLAWNKGIKKGNVRDNKAMDDGVPMLNFVSPQRLAAQLEIGEIFKSNFWGDVEVVRYNSSVDIVIRYIDSGNFSTVQLDALKKGLVKDIELQKQQTLNREYIRKQEARKRAIFEIHVRNLKILCKDLSRWNTQTSKEKRRLLREHYKNKFIKKTRQIQEYRKSTEYRQLIAKRNYEENREFRLQQAKDWQKNNPDKAQVRNRNARARRMGAEGSSTLDEQNILLITQDNKCIACKCDLSSGKHLDHIMPLALGGSNWIENLQWLCPFCNISKNAKHPDLWALEVATPEFQQRRNSRIILK